MDLYTIHYIKTHALIYKYLREDSHWYRYLHRDSKYIKVVEEEAKKYFKVTSEDKIKQLSDRIEMISQFLHILNE